MTKFRNIKNKNEDKKKQTSFISFLDTREAQWKQATYNPTYFDEVVYLGDEKSYALFAAYKSGSAVTIYRGIKGDEFDD